MNDANLSLHLRAIRNILNDAVKSNCAGNEILRNISVTLDSNIQTTGIVNIGVGESGTIASGMKSISIHNTGESEILISGEPVPPGEIVEYSATLNNVLNAISYDSQASTILITTLQ